MYKKILAIIISFLLVFNITVVNYKALPCYAIDGGIVVGGAVIGGEALAKIVMGVLASVGGAYIINEKKEDIKQFSGDVANSYIQYLDDEKNASVYTSQMFSNWLDKSYDAIRFGTSKAITISTDMYNSFKDFITELLQPIPDGNGGVISGNPINVSYGLTNEMQNYITVNNLDLDYFGLVQIDNYTNMRGQNVNTSVSAYRLNSLTNHFDVRLMSSLYDYIDGQPMFRYSLHFYQFRNDNTLYQDWEGFLFTSPKVGDNINLHFYNMTYVDTDHPIISTPSSDIPEWRQPIENNDIKIKSINGENLIDNYDVIDFTNSYVDSKTGNIVGDRTITIPTDLGSLDRIWDKYINGELTDEQLVTGVNDVIGVKGVDTSIDGVTDTITGVSLPLDTPIWGTTVGDTTGETVGDIVNESDKVNDSSVSGFPDLTEIFPFCIPFDILRLLKLLRTPMEVPVFEIPIDIPWFNVHYDMVLDMSQFSSLATIVRTFMALMWVVFLILATRRLIRA